MKFGCCISKVENIPDVKAAGFDYYEFSAAALYALGEEDFEQMKRLCIEFSLPCLGFNSFCSGNPVIVGNGFSPEDIEAYSKKISQRGKALGIKTLGIGAPKARRIPEEFPIDVADLQCREFLSIVSAVAKENGQSVLFEAVNSKLCNYAVKTMDAVKMVEHLKIDNLGIVVDFYHSSVMGETLDDISPALPFMKHVHFSTRGPGAYRGYPSDADRKEYIEILKWLKAAGYNSGISIEASEFNFDAAASCFVFLKGLCKELEINYE